MCMHTSVVHVGYVRYGLKTGSSMATPLVAGAAALVLSVLGTPDGNYYKWVQEACRRSIHACMHALGSILTTYQCVALAWPARGRPVERA